MAKLIDACGLACPGPVLQVKNAVEDESITTLSVLVDNAGSAENVTRFLQTKGFVVNETKSDGIYRLDALLNGAEGTASSENTAESSLPESSQKVMVLISSETIGSGDEELGRKLMLSYLKTVKEMGPDLWQLVFINGGVKLTTESSPVLQELKEYEDAGVIVLACGTCLEHFGITALKRVGETTNMLDIVSATQLADKVITIG